MLASLSIFSSAMPQPWATQVKGSSATITGRPVSSISILSILPAVIEIIRERNRLKREAK